MCPNKCMRYERRGNCTRYLLVKYELKLGSTFKLIHYMTLTSFIGNIEVGFQGTFKYRHTTKHQDAKIKSNSLIITI